MAKRPSAKKSHHGGQARSGKTGSAKAVKVAMARTRRISPAQAAELANSGTGGLTSTAVSAERVKVEVRNRFNPLRTVTPDLLSRYLDNFKFGYIRDAAQVWEAIEDRDTMLKNVASKRKKAVSRLNWEILTVEDSPEAEAQQALLKYFYNNLKATSVMEQNQRGGFQLLVRQMMDAIGKRYAVHEIVWKPETDPRTKIPRSKAQGGDDTGTIHFDTLLTAEFRFCPLWFFENITGRLRFLQLSTALQGLDMADGEWLVTVGDGIMEACSVAWMFKNLPMKDWLAYSEKFGMPGLLGKTDASKGSPRWDALVEAVQNFGQDFAAVCSTGDIIDTIESKGGAANLPQPPLVEYCDRMIASLWRGADLATISSSSGQGQGASLQGKESDLLEEDDAQLITETLNHQVDPNVIRYQLGNNVPILAYIKVLPNKKQNTEQELKVDTFLRDSGAPVSVNDTLARYGRPVPESGDALLVAPMKAATPPDPALANAKPAAAQHKLLTAAIDSLARAQAEDLQPLRDRLTGCLELSDDADLMHVALKKLQADLPAIRKEIGKNRQAASVLEKAMTAAFFNGLAEGEVKRA